MAENKMNQVAAMFGKKLEDVFKIEDLLSGQHCRIDVCFTEKKLKVVTSDYDWQVNEDRILRGLLSGEWRIDD